MAIAASELGEVASYLSELDDDREALTRAVTSRAYYWAFHTALEYAHARGYRLGKKKSRNSHHELWEWFKGKELDEIARLGFTLKNYRRTADYELGKKLNVGKSQSVRLAAELCELVRAAP